jgi:hypothetical protein
VEWQSRSRKDPVDEAVSFLTIRSAVAGVVQLDPQQGAHGPGLAEQEVHVLANDFVAVGDVGAVVAGLGIKEVIQRYFGADHGPVTDRRPQQAVEVEFGRRQKIVPSAIGQRFWPGGRGFQSQGP